MTSLVSDHVGIICELPKSADQDSRIKLLSLFPPIFKGLHVKDPVIETFTASKVTLKASRTLMLTHDGETFGKTPIEVTLLPGEIRMFC